MGLRHTNEYTMLSCSSKLRCARWPEWCATRAISPVELVESHLTQIAAQNPGINAFVTVLADEARAAARARRKRRHARRAVRIAARHSADG